MENQNKYHNGKIYKITDIGYNKCYIGSTTEELSQRMARHRASYKQFLRGGNIRHVRSYDLFNEYRVENCKIELIEYYKCDTLQELQRKEGEYIKNTECVNKIVAGRTHKERYIENREKMEKKPKKYRELYNDTIHQKDRENYQRQKEKIIKNDLINHEQIINDFKMWFESKFERTADKKDIKNKNIYVYVL